MARGKKPMHCTIGGIKHTLVVFEVQTKFPNGTPRQCARIPDMATVRVDTPEPKEFMTAYIPAVMLQK